ncbi:hypothetical protein QAD02_003301 [Eretmocerus hayati]|uniref:Uncharacterized protein n=1 Tax=Eretmocerus hayati TaxID=131215 RepID=A0ACC2NP84_9HYME|nr:hypothetical protein QAD02_003301 [Eretmocerus hayati]
MRFVMQKEGIAVLNLDNCSGGETKSKHGKLPPCNLRALFIGPSGCGKTNALLSLMFAPNGLAFENIYLYPKSLDQAKYRLLKAVMNELEDMNFYESTNSKEIIDPKDAKPNSLLIFDDVAHQN